LGKTVSKQETFISIVVLLGQSLAVSLLRNERSAFGGGIKAEDQTTYRALWKLKQWKTYCQS
jgi:hypothetical protein